MSCTVSSISSGGGSDWVDLPIPASQVSAYVDAPGGSWSLDKLSAAIDTAMTQVCAVIDVLGYSEIYYEQISMFNRNNACVFSNKVTSSEVTQAIASLKAMYEASPTTTVFYAYAGNSFAVSTSYLKQAPFYLMLYNNFSGQYQLVIVCDLHSNNSIITDSTTVVLKGRK